MQHQFSALYFPQCLPGTNENNDTTNRTTQTHTYTRKNTKEVVQENFNVLPVLPIALIFTSLLLLVFPA